MVCLDCLGWVGFVVVWGTGGEESRRLHYIALTALELTEIPCLYSPIKGMNHHAQHVFYLETLFFNYACL